MGRKASRTIYKLDFTDTPYGVTDVDGDPLEVSMTGLSVAEQLESLELEEQFRAAADNLAQVKPVLHRMIGMIAEHLVRWNLEDDAGNQIPPTPEALQDCDPLLFFDIVRAYRTAVMGVGKDSPSRSSGGEPALEASLPMEPLSENP